MTNQSSNLPLPTQRLLNIKQASKYCGMSPNHFKAHIRVAPLKFGNSTLYDRMALDAWLDKLRNDDIGNEPKGLGRARKNRAN